MEKSFVTKRGKDGKHYTQLKIDGKHFAVTLGFDTSEKAYEAGKIWVAEESLLSKLNPFD